MIENKKIIFLFIFFAICLKFFYAFFFFGGSDNLNFKSFYIFLENDFDLFSFPTPMPYLPFSTYLIILVGKLSDFSQIYFGSLFKIQSVFFDVLNSLLILKFCKQLQIKNSETICLFYLLNPLSIYFTSFLGFTDSCVIFFLLLSSYLQDFVSSSKISKYLIPFFLSVSLCSKPYTIIFAPLFFLKSETKLKFVTVMLFSIFFLNFHYILASLENPAYFNNIINYVSTKITSGHHYSFFGLGFVNTILIKELNLTNTTVLFFFILIILLSFFYISNFNRIKSYEFIYFTFLIIYLVSHNIHIQYFYWILPFMFIINHKYKDFYIFGFLILCLVFSLSWSQNSGILVPLRYLNFETSNYVFNLNYFGLFLFLIIFYICLFPNVIKNKISFFQFQILKENIKSIFNTRKIDKTVVSYEPKKLTFFICVFFFTNLIIMIFFFDLYSISKNKFNISVDANSKIWREYDLNKLNNIFYPKSVVTDKYGDEIKYITKVNLDENDTLEVNLISNDFFYLKFNEEIIAQGIGTSFHKNHGGKIKFVYKPNPIKIKNSLFKKENIIEIIDYKVNFYNYKGLGLYLKKNGKIIKPRNLTWQIFYNEFPINNQRFLKLKKLDYESHLNILWKDYLNENNFEIINFEKKINSVISLYISLLILLLISIFYILSCRFIK